MDETADPTLGQLRELTADMRALTRALEALFEAYGLPHGEPLGTDTGPIPRGIQQVAQPERGLE